MAERFYKTNKCHKAALYTACVSFLSLCGYPLKWIGAVDSVLMPLSPVEAAWCADVEAYKCAWIKA